MKIIDPHLHLFDLSQGEYTWLKPQCPPFWPDKSVIAKNFSEQDLTLSAPLALAGFVHIEAGFDNHHPWREIAWLESTCKMPFRSIAMLDITLPTTEFRNQLESLLKYPSVTGVRYILDDDASAILSDNNSVNNLATLADNQLSFELQMPFTDNEAVKCLTALLSTVNNLNLCINHAGLPPLNSAHFANWQENIKRIATFKHVFIKCSGYEMAERNYSREWQEKIIFHCLESFGINRLMLASNFPLSLWHSHYQKTWQNNLAQAQGLKLTTDAIEQLLFQNAYDFYHFHRISCSI